MSPKTVLLSALIAATPCAQEAAQQSFADKLAAEETLYLAVVGADECKTSASPSPMLWAPNIDVRLEWRLAAALATHSEMLNLRRDLTLACIANVFRPTGFFAKNAKSNPDEVEGWIRSHIKGSGMTDQNELDDNRKFTRETASETAKIVGRLKSEGMDRAPHASS